MQWKNQERYSLYWLSLNTGNLTPYYGLGRSLMDKGDYYGAATAFSTGYKHLNYGTYQMAADWGHCLDMLGFDKVALYWLMQAAKRDSHYAVTYQYIGLYFQKRGNLPEAQKAFKTAAGLVRYNS
jgi:tetratricopeptide (TPR) repeat protein